MSPKREVLLYIGCAIVLGASCWFTLRQALAANSGATFTLVSTTGADALAPAIILEGSPQAPWKVVEYLDYECPPCRRAALAARTLRVTLGDQVGWYISQYPLPIHHYARPLSCLALGAAKMGRFREVHDWLFDNQDLTYADKVLRVGEMLKMPPKAVQSLIASQGAELDRLSRLADRLAIGHTPTVFVVSPLGKVYEGSDPLGIQRVMSGRG